MVSHFYTQRAGRSGAAPIEAYPIKVRARRARKYVSLS